MGTEPDIVPYAEIVQQLCEKLRACYVFPDAAEQICAGLNKHLEAGEYSDIAEGEFFAYALTQHLQEVNHDEHLWVRWHAEALPDEDGQLRLNPQWQEERKLEARLANYGFNKVERLPGNVGCLEICYFHRPEWGGDTAAAAMNFLADTQALIIDLRQCTGGYPGMIALLLGYLFGEQPLLVDSIYWRDEDKIQEFWTKPDVPDRRYGDKPVYVLISRSTFSGGEEFAYALKIRQRATLIGDQTDGGANPGASYRLHPHFEVFIPIGCVTNPVSGTNWEGCGVTPDIALPQEQAFTAGYHMALQAVSENLGDAPKGAYRALAEEVQTALKELSLERIRRTACANI